MCIRDREEAVFYGEDPSYPVRVEVHVRSHRESDTFLQWAVDVYKRQVFTMVKFIRSMVCLLIRPSVL